MESQSGEMRRLHIVYFLSRKGHIEHPHLVRVHHFSRNGVQLRDIKRWLGELRGKEMPGSFSWSYKRRYKTGYVWQDLLDDDLITPISDNEYVLKGSEISSIVKDISYKQDENRSHSSEATSIYVSTKSPSEIEEESPVFSSETSTLTDDSCKLDVVKNSSVTKNDEKPEKTEDSLNKKSKKNSKKDENISSNTSSSQNKSNNSSNIFRNLMSCGAVDTNDSVVATKNKQTINKSFMNMCSSDLRNVEICKGDRIGGSQRVLGNPNWTQQQWSGRKSFDGVKDSSKNKSELRDQRAPFAAYKTVNWPNCSQCGKPFKPEKLHAHMKSCKKMKAIPKSAVNAENTSKVSKNEGYVSGLLLTH